MSMNAYGQKPVAPECIFSSYLLATATLRYVAATGALCPSIVSTQASGIHATSKALSATREARRDPLRVYCRSPEHAVAPFKPLNRECKFL